MSILLYVSLTYTSLFRVCFARTTITADYSPGSLTREHAPCTPPAPISATCAGTDSPLKNLPVSPLPQGLGLLPVQRPFWMTTKTATGGVSESGTPRNRPKMLQTKCLGARAAAPQQAAITTSMTLGAALPSTARGRALLGRESWTKRIHADRRAITSGEAISKTEECSCPVSSRETFHRASPRQHHFRSVRDGTKRGVCVRALLSVVIVVAPFRTCIVVSPRCCHLSQRLTLLELRTLYCLYKHRTGDFPSAPHNPHYVLGVPLSFRDPAVSCCIRSLVLESGNDLAATLSLDFFTVGAAAPNDVVNTTTITTVTEGTATAAAAAAAVAGTRPPAGLGLTRGLEHLVIEQLPGSSKTVNHLSRDGLRALRSLRRLELLGLESLPELPPAATDR